MITTLKYILCGEVRCVPHLLLGGSDYVGILLRFFSREVRGSYGSSPIDPGLEYISISARGETLN